jgi:biotin carboxylase
MKTVVIVASCESYRIQDFVDAAAVLRCRPVVASDGESPAAEHRFVTVDLEDPPTAAAAIARDVPEAAAVVAADDSGVVVAARAAALLGLPHNPVAAASATRDKLLMREALTAGGVSQPEYRWGPAAEIPKWASQLGFPVVIKPRRMSASRGVIRANGPAEADAAAQRALEITVTAGHDPEDGLLVESYVPGVEIAIEGLLIDGTMEVLAIIDKPVPLEGPYFAETIFVTPSRLATDVIARATAAVAAGCAALELTSGPVHAEVRIDPSGEPYVIEVAARTIGGLCGRSLAFGLLGETLETVVLRGALAEPNLDVSPARPASGVMMLPVEDGGVLDDIEGIDEVLAIPGITAVDITATKGKRVEALPAADRYLGFVFAVGDGPATVEGLLRRAAAELTVVIDGEDVGPLI